jgi:hypothetical protein
MNARMDERALLAGVCTNEKSVRALLTGVWWVMPSEVERSMRMNYEPMTREDGEWRWRRVRGEYARVASRSARGHLGRRR